MASYGASSSRGQSSRSSKRRITEEEWLQHKDTIEYLYLDDSKDVKEVRNIMKRDWGFDAHEKAYKRKFEEWGFVKNIPKDEGLFMVKKRESRRGEGKDTIFRRRRRTDGPFQPVSDDKIDRIADRYSHDLANWPEDPDTPDNVEYSSPEDDEIPFGGMAQPTFYSQTSFPSALAPMTTAASAWPTTAQAQYGFDPQFLLQPQDPTMQQMQWPGWPGYMDPNDPSWHQGQQ